MECCCPDRQPVRFEEQGLGIYVWPDAPDWCVPNARGEFILRRCAEGLDEGTIARDYAGHFGCAELDAVVQVHQFLQRAVPRPAEPYLGREEYLTLGRLRECWLHITNRCNARCRHCMFSSSQSETARLDAEQALGVVREASRLGCELFYFTGGEPFVHDGMIPIAEHILRHTPAHIVVLTNGVAAEEFLPRMADWSRDRVHLQVSVDGAQGTHDLVRGRNAYRHLIENLARMVEAGFPVTLAMAVHRENLDDMPHVVELAARLGIHNVHYLWLFTRGKAEPGMFAPPQAIYPRLIEAAELAERSGVLIDNIEILKSQVFAIPGTRFDLSNAGWEALAVGPDGGIYPSPALVGKDEARCGHVRDGLEAVWRRSAKLAELRSASIACSPEYLANPVRFLVGGGDIDHSLSHAGSFVGHDPYVPLYNRVALWLIAREAARFREVERPGFRARMGERLHECGAEGDGVRFTHSNCVLSLPRRDGHALARDFYAWAAVAPAEEILNPVRYGEDEVAFIPEQARVRSFGCGSPVRDAGLRQGDVVVDLGCGTGVECFIASARVGPAGRVIGVDMLPQMLARARRAAAEVGQRLGYRNVTFCRGLLEHLPLPDESADVVVSNCVLNLSPEKRQAFHEMFRVLKRGGRIVISDVASEGEIPIAIQYSERLRGECLGGAFKQDRLFGLLADVGFHQATILKRFPYRKVRGHQFHSLTYSAVKPALDRRTRVIYPGPFAAVVTDDGQVVPRGEAVELAWSDPVAPEGGPSVLDEAGGGTCAEQAPCCACSPPPEEAVAEEQACCSRSGASEDAGPRAEAEPKHRADCMVCGAPIQYFERERDETCHYCGQSKRANAVCDAGHFVCDACHSEDALAVIERLLVESTETDMAALLKRIRRHHAIPIHGPEHHSLVPGIIVAAYRNAGGRVPPRAITTAIERGATIAGGACAFSGVCGAATGVGTGFSILLRATPLKGAQRQLVQQAAARVLAELGRFEAARCCQRECWIGLRVAAEVSRDLLPIALTADEPLECDQFGANRECIGARCSLRRAADGQGNASGEPAAASTVSGSDQV